MTGKRPSITKTPSVAEYQRIRKYVIDSVLAAGNMPVRLASMRELAGEFGVSIATVQRALKELTDDGYLTARKGVGLFTNPDRAWLRGKCDVIGVLAADGRQIYFENFLWNLLASTGRAVTGTRRLLYNVSLMYTTERVLGSMELSSMAGMIWLGPDFAPSAAADGVARALTVPVVTVNDRREGFSCVSMDVEQEGYEVGRRLLAEGRTSPIVVAKRRDMLQIAGLERAFREAGVPFNDRLLVLRGAGMEERLGTMLDLLDAPQAIYAVGGMLRDIAPLLRRHKLDCGRCRLIGEASVWEPDFRGWVVDQDFDALAAAACNRLFSEMRGGPRRDCLIPRIIREWKAGDSERF